MFLITQPVKRIIQYYCCIIFIVENKCVGDYFQCGDGTCISWQKVCDFQRDCDNGADEEICGIVYTVFIVYEIPCLKLASSWESFILMSCLRTCIFNLFVSVASG